MTMEMHAGMEDCCDDEWALKIVEDDQQASASKETPATAYHLLHEVSFNDFVISTFSQEEDIEVNNTGPPDIPSPNLNILYHNLKLPAALQS